MSEPLRSKHGCWTCRLRKKKCDEHHPHCTTCGSLSITCYGYGPKPAWMSDADKTREILNGLKNIVKQTSKRKSTAQFSKKRSHTTRIAPRLTVPSSRGQPIHQHLGTSPLGSQPVSKHGPKPRREGDSTSSYASSDNSRGDVSKFHFQMGDSTLIMHFLDHVFPMLFPMYKPGIAEGGRGWLLAFVLRSRPLQHAILALSAHHRRMAAAEETDHAAQVNALVLQEQHLQACLQFVSESAKQSCSKGQIAMAATIIQLVFFELITGNKRAWQPHFRLALNMYLQAYREVFGSLGVFDDHEARVPGIQPLPRDEPDILEGLRAFRFFSNVLLWLDITFSITTGASPVLHSHDFFKLGSNSQIQLEHIMGCQNWVMIEIARISVLRENYNQIARDHLIECAELAQTADDISRKIQFELAQMTLGDLDISRRNAPQDAETISDPRRVITYIFANMASVYLHLVTHDFQKLEILAPSVTAVVTAVRTQSAANILPALVCPLFLIGLVASHNDQQFFRGIFTSPPVMNSSLQHRGAILLILEDVWRRRSTETLHWTDILELTPNILLV
ncbi:fungal-specific transcription factor domain-containing protein [Xylariales sp. PMI_506]|nr:fungal-specific transcription factor domain-containing protein [Xylariales sp. PMI_506]